VESERLQWRKRRREGWRRNEWPSDEHAPFPQTLSVTVCVLRLLRLSSLTDLLVVCVPSGDQFRPRSDKVSRRADVGGVAM